MGKLIPPRTYQSSNEAPRPVAHANPGPLQLLARELTERLSQVEETLDLDELDRIARRHARPPASGSAEALDALAVVVRWAPEIFARSEVNLEPRRLLHLADRERALAIVNKVVTRFSDLAQDSQAEEGDEIVELLTVGCARSQALDPAEIQRSDELAAAMEVLSGYQQRVIAEGAHRIPAQDDPPKKPRKK